MNVAGIDVSKGHSTVTIVRLFGEVVASPFEVGHTEDELGRLAERLKSLNGETRVVMEHTGSYCQPIARFLHEEEIFVSVVHAQLVHDFGNNSIRRVKTDKADAVKIAAYGLANWSKLPKFIPEEDIRQMLKAYSRQYDKYIKLKTSLKNNVISLLDQTFPGVNTLFTSPAKNSDTKSRLTLRIFRRLVVLSPAVYRALMCLQHTLRSKTWAYAQKYARNLRAISNAT